MFARNRIRTDIDPHYVEIMFRIVTGRTVAGRRDDGVAHLQRKHSRFPVGIVHVARHQHTTHDTGVI